MRTRIFAILNAPRFLYIALGLGLLLRLLMAAIYPAEPISDFSDYHELALSLARGEGYAIQGVSTAFRPVGWPALLALFYRLLGASWVVGLLLNLLLSLAYMYLVFVVAQALTKARFIAHLSVFCIAIHPNSIAYTQLLSAELPFVCCVLMACWCILKGKENLLLAGLFFGLATLVKSQGLLLPLVVGYFLIKRKSHQQLAMKLGFVYLALILSLSPWLIRNQLTFGQFPVLVTNGSANLLVGNNPFANGKYKWGDQEIAWYAAQAPQAQGEVEQAAKARNLAFTYLKNQPFEALKRLPSKLWYTYKADYEGLDWLRESCGGLTGWRHRLMQLTKAFAQIFYLFLLLTYGYLISKSIISKSVIPTSSHSQIPTSALLLYFSLIALLFFGDGRFHFPLIPWLCMSASVAIIPNNWKEKANGQEQN